MADVLEIPTSPSPQRFQIQLAGVRRILTLRWCQAANCWALDIADQNGVPMLCGLLLVTGADLLGQFAYVGLAGHLLVQTDHNANAVPTYDNLGSAGHLYFIPDAA